MSGRTTSRVFAAWRGVHAILSEGASWPTHPVTNRRPQIVFGDDPPELGHEVIAVVGRIEDDAEISWETLQRSLRFERFFIEMVVRTAVPGQSGARVVDRLEELCDVVQRRFWDPDTAVWNGPLTEDQPGFLSAGGIVRVMPVLFQLDEGWGGEARIVLAVTTSI